MTPPRQVVWPATMAELQILVRGFEDGTWPKERWSHRAHIAIAVHYLKQLPASDALAVMRHRIQRYNERQGIPNTATAGYHETLTVFWMGVLARFVASGSDGALAATQQAMVRFGCEGRLAADLYTFGVARNEQARKQWVAPDVWDLFTLP